MPATLVPVQLTAATGVVTAAAWSLPSLDDVVTWLSDYPAVVVLAAITVAGELVVLAAVLVALEGSWSLTEVVVWCFVGTVVSDAAWFRLAGVADDRLVRRGRPNDRQTRALAWLRERTGQRPYLALLFIKFLYGSRFLMLVYLATRRIPLRTFLLYDAAGTAAWLAVLVPLGWLVARGLVTAEAAGRLDLVALTVVAAVLVVRGGSAWWTSRRRRRSLRS